MSKVINEFHVDKYAVLILDNMPDRDYHRFVIREKEYTPVPIFDSKNCVAVESNESFIGETIEFLN